MGLPGFQGKYFNQCILALRGSTSVGQFEIHLASLSGFSYIIVTASSKHEKRLKYLGGTRFVDHDCPLSELASVHGLKMVMDGLFTLVFDVVGSPATQQALYDALVPRGKLALIAMHSEIVISPSPGDAKSVISVQGLLTFPANEAFGTEVCASARELFATGNLKVR
ncbi:hypothetical protein DFH07DRAFT_129523 [Mycena maculata]|uniref:Alcohol dehydrogenase-like C-terminal domain-containing protein n=1 Tax=Mycena maculata TaxID=230809 RepID=A0AAD7I3Q7_9AGAR|nr:hypothetical protein DFH07DRAFT_129523 [Mycena maculata]